MTVKRLIVITAVWTVVTVGVGLVGVWYILEHPIRGATPEARAGRLGSGVATITAIGYAVLWFPWAYKVGQKRRQERERQAREKRRPRRAGP